MAATQVLTLVVSDDTLMWVNEGRVHTVATDVRDAGEIVAQLTDVAYFARLWMQLNPLASADELMRAIGREDFSASRPAE